MNIQSESLMCLILNTKPEKLSVGGSLFVSAFNGANGYAQLSRTITASVLVIDHVSRQSESVTSSTSTHALAKLLSYTYMYFSNPTKVNTAFSNPDILDELALIADIGSIKEQIDKRKKTDDTDAEHQTRKPRWPQQKI